MPVTVIAGKRTDPIHLLAMAHSYRRAEYWQNSIGENPPTVEYEEIQESSGMGELLQKIVRYEQKGCTC